MREWFVADYDVWKDFGGPAVTLIGFAINDKDLNIKAPHECGA